MWHDLDEPLDDFGRSSREMCEVIIYTGWWGHHDFAKNVLKQGRISEKQFSVIRSMYYSAKARTSRRKYRGYVGKDWDEYCDLGYEGHPGQFDGEGGFY